MSNKHTHLKTNVNINVN